MGVPPHTEPLYLEPMLASRLASLLRSGPFLHGLVRGLGSPLNLVLPEQIADNLARFRAVHRRHRLGGQVYFAHKASRSRALVRRLAATDAGIDVASAAEAQHALGAGFAPGRVLATGPKNPAFLWLAARSGTTVHIDGAAELDALAGLVRRYGLPRVRIVLRLSAFSPAPASPVTPAASGTAGAAGGGVRQLSRRSRFGTPVAELDPLLKTVERHADAVELTGVGYHLDTTSLAEKALALEGCVLALNECRGRGLTPRVIDIGGGFGVNYLAHAAQWERWTTELTQAVLGRREPLTWRRHGYGLRNEGGTLRGALALYPAHRPVAAERYLDALLAHPAPTLGRPLASLLLENLYDLCTEPGRALADQCGATLARVLEVRRTEDGEPLVRLEANADDIGLEEHGVHVDPVLVPRGRGHEGGPVGVHLAGNLCLEADLITRRKVFLPRPPRPGDLLAFANTAGYCMDFSADEAQQQPVARKVAVWQEPEEAADGHPQDGHPQDGHPQDGEAWRWTLDEEYWPIAERED
ncbi:Y4yA family PLP-dependent enzyme [Streptomyces albiaxialis]|uniref:Y4yA family PLP-dependent enzyme n=1 Tax=Streptomyces albiaxialis TaxID=329523 RepID=A0ABN2W101_9ACTN